MNRLRFFLILAITAGFVVPSSASNLDSSTKAKLSQNHTRMTRFSAFANSELTRELQRAFAVSAKYQNVSQAEADGYIPDVYEEGEGFHYFQPDYYDDGVFDIDHPETLLYVPDEHGKLRLAALEYLVPYDPDSPIPPAPDGFTGDDDVWRAGQEGFPEWALNVWIWAYNPDGVFASKNPLVP